jgi:hypothetical protein
VVGQSTSSSGVHPWKLRTTAGDRIEIYKGICQFHGSDLFSTDPAGWQDSGFGVPLLAEVPLSIYIIIYGTIDGTSLYAFWHDSNDPTDLEWWEESYVVFRAYLVGSVSPAAAVVQVARSNIYDDDEMLLPGDGVEFTIDVESTPETVGFYDGRSEVSVNVDIDAVATLVQDEIEFPAPTKEQVDATEHDHNSHSGIQNLGTQAGTPHVHSHVVPQEWTGTTLQDLIDALVAAGVLYLPEE